MNHRPSLEATLLALFLALIATDITAQEHSVSPGSGRTIASHPSSITQTETFVTLHPTNPNVLFASANTINLANWVHQ